MAEQVLPGLSDNIQQCFTITPLTYRDYTLTPQGSAFGLRKDYRQGMLTAVDSRTPYENLSLTGQSLMVHGVEGVTRLVTDSPPSPLSFSEGEKIV